MNMIKYNPLFVKLYLIIINYHCLKSSKILPIMNLDTRWFTEMFVGPSHEATRSSPMLQRTLLAKWRRDRVAFRWQSSGRWET